jgi:hypothetical protein
MKMDPFAIHFQPYDEVANPIPSQTEEEEDLFFGVAELLQIRPVGDGFEFLKGDRHDLSPRLREI